VTGHAALRPVPAAGKTRARRPAHAGRRRRLATIGAAALLATTLTALSHQYAKTYTLARERLRLEQRRRDLIADNARLREEIERLQTDDRYVEEIARRQLGLVRPGEIELLVVPYNGTVSAPAGTPRGDAPARMDGAPIRVGEDPAAARSSADGAAGPDPVHRDIREWAVGVRDAVWRLLHLLLHR
jgi:cell division protein FtsB